MAVLPHLFTLPAIATAISSLFALIVGIWGIQASLRKRVRYPLWGITFLVALVPWIANAILAADADAAKRELLDAMNRNYSPPAVLPADAPPWLLVAFKEIGQKEIPGYSDNPRIIEYFRSIRPSKVRRDDLDDWSSAFVEWAFEQVGKFGPKDLKPNSWLRWGRTTLAPRPGSVVILSFSGLNHVGFYYGEEGEFIQVLGGNQNDQVCVNRYPKSAVKGYREPME